MMKVNHDVNNRNVTFSFVLLMDDEFFRTSDTSERSNYYLKAQDHCISAKKTNVNITLDYHQNDKQYRTEMQKLCRKNSNGLDLPQNRNANMTTTSFFFTKTQW